MVSIYRKCTLLRIWVTVCFEHKETTQITMILFKLSARTHEATTWRFDTGNVAFGIDNSMIGLNALWGSNIVSLKRKFCHFGEIVFNGYTESYFNNFQYSQWRKFRRNDDLFVTVIITHRCLESLTTRLLPPQFNRTKKIKHRPTLLAPCKRRFL